MTHIRIDSPAGTEIQVQPCGFSDPPVAEVELAHVPYLARMEAMRNRFRATAQSVGLEAETRIFVVPPLGFNAECGGPNPPAPPDS